MNLHVPKLKFLGCSALLVRTVELLNLRKREGKKPLVKVLPEALLFQLGSTCLSTSSTWVQRTHKLTLHSLSRPLCLMCPSKRCAAAVTSTQFCGELGSIAKTARPSAQPAERVPVAAVQLTWFISERPGIN